MVKIVLLQISQRTEARKSVQVVTRIKRRWPRFRGQYQSCHGSTEDTTAERRLGLQAKRF